MLISVVPTVCTYPLRLGRVLGIFGCILNGDERKQHTDEKGEFFRDIAGDPCHLSTRSLNKVREILHSGVLQALKSGFW